MDTASKILILGGVLNLAYGLLTGIPASIIRQKQPTYSKYLRLVHIGALMWGPLLISLTLALMLSPLAEGIETLAASLMVAASFLLDAKDTLNWRMGIQDEFAEKPVLPLAFGALSSLASLAGMAIILVGVVQGL
ncbi:MAG: hypothetical protein H7175_19580 [Burkholderiales bacterium]|nr:hypothetical protein [Anaerolineae bacterium]